MRLDQHLYSDDDEDELAIHTRPKLCTFFTTITTFAASLYAGALFTVGFDMDASCCKPFYGFSQSFNYAAWLVTSGFMVCFAWLLVVFVPRVALVCCDYPLAWNRDSVIIACCFSVFWYGCGAALLFDTTSACSYFVKNFGFGNFLFQTLCFTIVLCNCKN
jgi:hypothetical protein